MPAVGPRNNLLLVFNLIKCWRRGSLRPSGSVRLSSWTITTCLHINYGQATVHVSPMSKQHAFDLLIFGKRKEKKSKKPSFSPSVIQAWVAQVGKWINTSRLHSLSVQVWTVIKGQHALDCFQATNTNSLFYWNKLICRSAFCRFIIHQLDAPRHLGIGTSSTLVFNFLSQGNIASSATSSTVS